VSALLADKVAVIYGGGGAIGAVAREAGRIELSGCREVFEGVSRSVGIPVHEMIAQHGRSHTLLGRLPRLTEVAEFAAFAVSDRAGAMTGAIANLTCGSLTD
jgi:3-oxoacyl-[acyl-carrier protein] reductase